MYFIEENIKPQVYRTYVNFVVNISWSGNSYNVFLKKKVICLHARRCHPL